jgi:hypothetical protein
LSCSWLLVVAAAVGGVDPVAVVAIAGDVATAVAVVAVVAAGGVVDVAAMAFAAETAP